tara:strand:- start:623 stop:1672 length:1050 start_codon:yes stop_codon:yes gene_type:complete
MIETNYKDIFEIEKKVLDDIDSDLYPFLEFWRSEKSEIIVHTSGSTGKPKEISISKKQMINSADATINHFKLKNQSTILSCLPLKYIGGKMMIVRGIKLKAKIILVKPKVNPFRNIEKKIDLLALTSLQLHNLTKESKNFRNIKLTLIGGGSLSEEIISKINKLPNEFYQTYGMTETVSHIAVRNLKKLSDNPNYKCLKGNTIRTNLKNQLIINSEYLNIESLTTNDLSKVSGNKEFTIFGRLDNIINSGGLKIPSLDIENQIKKTLKNDLFFIDKINCNKLGEKMIVIALEVVDLDRLKLSIKKIKDKKYRPKEIYLCSNFIYNQNQKVDKIKTKYSSIQQNNVHNIN